MVHAYRDSLPFEGNCVIGRTATNKGHLIFFEYRITLEESSDTHGYLRAIQLWHTIIQQYNLVHLGLAYPH